MRLRSPRNGGGGPSHGRRIGTPHKRSCWHYGPILRNGPGRCPRRSLGHLGGSLRREGRHGVRRLTDTLAAARATCTQEGSDQDGGGGETGGHTLLSYPALLGDRLLVEQGVAEPPEAVVVRRLSHHQQVYQGVGVLMGQKFHA